MDLIGPWNRLLGIMPSTVLNLLAVIGIGLIVFSIGKFFWDRRRGGGAQGFPWLVLLLGGVLAGPRIIVPALLMIVQAILNVFVALFKSIGAF